MNSPLVSVLLLTYNHEKFIAQAIESVLMQKTDFDFEIIIGNDCSTDNTGEIIKRFIFSNKKNIREVAEKNNIGALQNEKNIMESAKGKYIAFLEGDDYWTDPYKLQKQVDFLEANPDYGLVHGDVNHYFENTKKVEFQVNKNNKLNVPEGHVFYHLLKPQPLFIKTATSCFRKDLVSKYFDYELAIKENWPLTDLALWMDITYNSKTHYFDEVFATYRLLNESASRTTSPEKKYNFYKSLYKIKQLYMDKYNCSDAIRKELEEDYYRSMIKIAYNLNDYLLIQESINFLKERDIEITQKENLMLLFTKHKMLKKAFNFIKKLKI